MHGMAVIAVAEELCHGLTIELHIYSAAATLNLTRGHVTPGQIVRPNGMALTGGPLRGAQPPHAGRPC